MRNRVWSSTSTTRIGSLIAALPACGGNREAEGHPGACLLSGGEGHFGIQVFGPFAHDVESEVHAAVRVHLAGDADAIILDADDVAAFPDVDRQAHMVGAGVFGYVVQRLPHDVVDLDFLVGAEVDVGRLIDEIDGDAGLVVKIADDIVQRRQQAARVHPVAELGEQFAQFGIGGIQRLTEIVDVFVGARLVAVRHGVAQQRQAHFHVGHGLGERVMQFVGQHLALVGQA